MAHKRSILWNGLLLVLAQSGPLLWTYTFNFGIALLFSLRLHAQLGSILDHSLAAERLTSAFDLGTVLGASHRLSEHAPGSGSTNYLGLPLYLLLYFVLVPGTLFSYRTEAPARLSILLSSGLSFFWRFVRITLLTLLLSAVVLIPLSALEDKWSTYIDARAVGVPALLETVPGVLILALIACFLRLYFDLVEVYTVQLGEQTRTNGKPDRRVRRTLLPALRTLSTNFPRAYLTFISLTILGLAAVLATGALAAQMLAQPRAWPIFLLAQAGLFVMLLTRFWQRGAETILAADNPLQTPALFHATQPVEDPQPNPEPAAPSLTQPDPGVFHHEAGVSD
jgi:hypothetical protein